jgi:hypothetical protein
MGSQCQHDQHVDIDKKGHDTSSRSPLPISGVTITPGLRTGSRARRFARLMPYRVARQLRHNFADGLIPLARNNLRRAQDIVINNKWSCRLTGFTSYHASYIRDYAQQKFCLDRQPMGSLYTGN